MNRAGAVHDEVRERDERDARFFAWDVPGDVHIVGLVHETGEAERSATVADAIATSVARRREHTLLLSLDPGPSPLDELLGGTHSEGLPAALEGRMRLTDVAVQRVDRPFVYLPAGADPGAVRALLEDDLLASFVDRVRERGGTLFIVLSEADFADPALLRLLDGYVALGEVQVPEPAAELPAYGRVRFDVEETGAAAERAAEREDAGPPVAEATLPGDRSVSSGIDRSDSAPSESSPSGPRIAGLGNQPGPDPSRRVSGLFGGALGIVVILGGWWLLGRGNGEGVNEFAGQTPPIAVDEDAPDAPPFDPVAASSAFDRAPEAPYSVLIASYAARADADDRGDALRESGAGLYFVAPTPVRGVLYHRVFAGALPDRETARAAMAALVERGRKDEAGAWHLRPVRLAFDLGVFPDRASAEERIAALAARGIPAYALMATSPGGSVWRVYVGAYENERAAAPMAAMLEDLREPARLVDRRGLDPDPIAQ